MVDTDHPVRRGVASGVHLSNQVAEQIDGTVRVLLNPPPGRPVMIWIQVRDIHAEHARLAAVGVPVVQEPAAEPWGLIEMWIADPGGIRIVLAEVPAGHPLRRDPRSALPLR
jgi:predicted enzyme related to lactoylglutathione lyase